MLIVRSDLPEFMFIFRLFNLSRKTCEKGTSNYLCTDLKTVYIRRFWNLLVWFHFTPF